jgi:NAD+ kinase
MNLGRLGFLSSVSRDNIRLAVDALVQKRYRLENRTLLRLETQDNLFGELNFALNDLTIYKKDPYSMLTISAYVDGIFLNSYWADGLIIATPTGSTAYSLSCGGPIVVPGSENFIITPIASHNLTVRPIVIPDKSRIRVQIEGRNQQFFVSLDSRFEIVDSSLELIIEKEDFKINLLRLDKENFYRTIREKLNWGLDIRNYPSENT